VTHARYLSMNNVRAQSAQKSQNSGCYVSRARRRWRWRNAHRKSHQGRCGAARAAKSSHTPHCAGSLRLETRSSQEELFDSSNGVPAPLSGRSQTAMRSCSRNRNPFGVAREVSLAGFASPFPFSVCFLSLTQRRHG